MPHCFMRGNLLPLQAAREGAVPSRKCSAVLSCYSQAPRGQQQVSVGLSQAALLLNLASSKVPCLLPAGVSCDPVPGTAGKSCVILHCTALSLSKLHALGEGYARAKAVPK